MAFLTTETPSSNEFALRQLGPALVSEFLGQRGHVLTIEGVKNHSQRATEHARTLQA